MCIRDSRARQTYSASSCRHGPTMVGAGSSIAQGAHRPAWGLPGGEARRRSRGLSFSARRQAPPVRRIRSRSAS
eukprot:371693-Alexandrium_andersonii.AAC.1